MRTYSVREGVDYGWVKMGAAGKRHGDGAVKLEVIRACSADPLLTR